MSSVTVESVATVGPQTVALTFETPADFDAAPGQFVLLRTPDGESGYYTISSPDADGTFEVTVGYPADASPTESLGAWLADRDVGDTVDLDGPYGTIQYRGEGAVAVLAAGPGIGPAVGIAERAVANGHAAAVAYLGEDPSHADRLDRLAERGARVAVVDDLDAVEIAVPTSAIYVFGFEEFVAAARERLEADGRDPADAAIESFGPA